MHICKAHNNKIHHKNHIRITKMAATMPTTAVYTGNVQEILD